MTFQNQAHTALFTLALIALVNGFPITTLSPDILDNETAIDANETAIDAIETNFTDLFEVNEDNEYGSGSSSGGGGGSGEDADSIIDDTNSTNSTNNSTNDDDDDDDVRPQRSRGIEFLIVFGILICGGPVCVLIFYTINCVRNCCGQICHDYKVGRDYRKENRLNRPRVVMRTKLEKFDKKTTKFGSECNICMTAGKTKQMITLPCKHSFHKKCIEPWIFQEAMENRTPCCPTCRAEIYDEVEISKIRGTYSPNPVWYPVYDSDDDWGHDEY